MAGAVRFELTARGFGAVKGVYYALLFCISMCYIYKYRTLILCKIAIKQNIETLKILQSLLSRRKNVDENRPYHYLKSVE